MELVGLRELCGTHWAESCVAADKVVLVAMTAVTTAMMTAVTVTAMMTAAVMTTTAAVMMTGRAARASSRDRRRALFMRAGSRG